jgi:N-methylhydantoinase A
MAETMLVGVDVGGTFTDLVLVDEASGAVRMANVPTTVANQAATVMLTAADPPAVDRHATDELRRRGRR